MLKTCFEFLSPRSDHLTEVDLIVGFGHFDEKIPKTCCDLFRQGLGSKILFTGGIGAGTNDLSGAEADYFLEIAQNYAPEISLDHYIIENASTNTAENLRNSDAKLMMVNEQYSFSSGVKSILVVANAYRQLRVLLTIKKLFPHIACLSFPPETDYHLEKNMFAQKNEDFDQLLMGELQRLIDYPIKGFIVPCEMPKNILEYIKFNV